MNEHAYRVELIHEASGAVMNMTVFTDEAVDEVEMARLIWADMSVVVLQYFEGDEDENL